MVTMNLYATYLVAASKAASSRTRANITPTEYNLVNARADAEEERKARNAYLASQPEAKNYLNSRSILEKAST